MGNIANPAADFEIALGVLLKGDKMNFCIGGKDSAETLNLNAKAVEGSFKGFKIIEEYN